MGDAQSTTAATSVIRSIEFAEFAGEDVAGAVVGFDAVRPGLGCQFIVDLGDCLHRICRHPYSYQRFEADCRRAVLRRFQYAVVYRVLAAAIQVVAVFPCRIDPVLMSKRVSRPLG